MSNSKPPVLPSAKSITESVTSVVAAAQAFANFSQLLELIHEQALEELKQTKAPKPLLNDEDKGVSGSHILD